MKIDNLKIFVSPTNPSQLEDQLTRLPAATREDILSFFSQDLRSLDSKKIVGNLEMALMFMRASEEPEFKKQVFAHLSTENRQMRELVDYLQKTGVEDPAVQEKEGKVSLHPQDYVQTSFPDNDHFDFRDMQEVDKFRGAGALPFIPHQFQEKVNAVLKIVPGDIQERFRSDPLLQKRFESVIVTYLKDIRDKLETFSRLAAQEKEGGVGLGYETAEQIFSVLEGKANRVEDIHRLEPIPFDKGSLIDRDSTLQKATPLPPAPPFVRGEIKGGAGERKPLPAEGQEILPQKQPIKELIPLQKIHITGAVSSKAQKVMDIKPPPQLEKKQKILDPVEIYSTLTIEDLRRERSPEEFARKFYEKIQSESAADYTHRAKMIGAWKRSPVYKLYLAIGQGSLVQGVNVAEYLIKSAGENSMTYQEFEAIAELNRKLRF